MFFFNHVKDYHFMKMTTHQLIVIINLISRHIAPKEFTKRLHPSLHIGTHRTSNREKVKCFILNAAARYTLHIIGPTT